MQITNLLATSSDDLLAAGGNVLGFGSIAVTAFAVKFVIEQIAKRCFTIEPKSDWDSGVKFVASAAGFAVGVFLGTKLGIVSFTFRKVIEVAVPPMFMLIAINSDRLNFLDTHVRTALLVLTLIPCIGASIGWNGVYGSSVVATGVGIGLVEALETDAQNTTTGIQEAVNAT